MFCYASLEELVAIYVVYLLKSSGPRIDPWGASGWILISAFNPPKDTERPELYIFFYI